MKEDIELKSLQIIMWLASTYNYFVIELETEMFQNLLIKIKNINCLMNELIKIIE